MAEKTLFLEIVTPEKSVFSGDVISVFAPGTEGYFQILYNHTPFLSTLHIGEIRVNIEGTDQLFATSGGFAEVSDNKISILAETAEKAENINLERAMTAKSRAEERLNKARLDVDIDGIRAQLSLYRAVNRIHTAGKLH